ncbi:calcium-activated potassium channel subunit alpha-1-like [Hemitrygon akajei]|uniref:calcium-activated potassium channel subunit alpha-1-like n=1 Tax=Hemitrygon akajei TaxID=2704970 RepID=UPI003BF9772C
MGNSFFAALKLRFGERMTESTVKQNLDSEEIEKPSVNCRIINQDMWWGAIGSSFTVFVGGLLLIVLYRGIRICYTELHRISYSAQDRWKKSKERKSSHASVFTGKHISHPVLQEQKESVTSQNRKPPSFTLTALSAIPIGPNSLEAVYGNVLVGSIEGTWVVLRTLEVVDLGFNCFFLFYFGLRFIAADDKLVFWIELNSIVDIFTIPPVVISLYFKRDCIGLRFLRTLRLIQLPEILQYLRILKKHTKIKLVSLLSVFVGAWLTAAGFIHTIENSGDPWRQENNSHQLTYWQCVYLLLVTMSTVGFGDLTARTTLGQVFMAFFIILGMVLFASHVPEIIELIGTNRKYTGSYSVVMGKKHIIVCGHITLSSLHELLKNFNWKEKEESSTIILILEDFNPGLELQALFKRHLLQMQFFQGSVLKPTDLDRVQLDKANACLILADKNCLNPEAEDSANIMKAIAVKQYSPKIRIIAQVLQYHSMGYLQNLPSWNLMHRDSVICLNELKMGFIAQNCLLPGFSTLLANLFIKKSQVEHKTGTWLDIYQEGVSQEIFTEYLSDAFVGMSFPEVCQICYLKLKLLLIAIQYRTGAETVSIVINPTANILIEEQTLGFFIAKKQSHVQKANYYCNECHSDVHNPRCIGTCTCRKKLSKDKPLDGAIRVQSFGVLPRQIASTELIDSMLAREKVSLDSTGMFHWCPPRAITEVTLSRAAVSRLQLSNHVIVCIFSEPKFPAIGLRNFVMPLRASSFTYKELKAIVFVVSLEYVTKEWETICNFPKVFILPGSPLCRADLKAANIATCDMTVVISSNRIHFEEKSLEDKECILATLNLKAMLFEKIKSSNVPATKSVVNFSANTDTCASVDRYHYRVPIITSLVHQSNVYFLDQEDRDDPDTDLYLTKPYASGCVFAFSILNSLTCMTYFNDNILLLIRTLVTGGSSPELDEQLADEDALRGSINAQNNVDQRNRCKLAYITMCDKRFEEFAHGGKYGDLFCKALLQYGMLCFGIFRLQDPAKQSKKRFVITNPLSSFELTESDFIMCTVPFYDTETITANVTSQMGYLSKFVPLHTVSRQASVDLRADYNMYSRDYARLARREEDRKRVGRGGSLKAAKSRKRRYLERSTLRKILNPTIMERASQEGNRKSLPFITVQHYGRDTNAGKENRSSTEVEVNIVMGEGMESTNPDAESQGAALKTTGAAVNTVPEINQLPVATTPGPSALPVGTTPGPSAQPVGTTPGPSALPVGTTPGPSAQPVGTTPGPSALPVGTTSGPSAQPVGTTPGPSAQPVGTTPGPSAQPVGTTPGPSAQPVGTTPGPSAQPVGTTPGPSAQPVGTTPGPSAQPVGTTPGPSAQPVGTTPGPSAQPVGTTPGPSAQPVGTTPGPSAQPVGTTPGPSAQPVGTTPGPSAQPVGTTPGPRAQPVGTTPGPSAQPVGTTPGPSALPAQHPDPEHNLWAQHPDPEHNL